MSNIQGQTDLLVEGANSYPQAFAALCEFRRRMLDAARSVVKTHLKELEVAMGISNLNPTEIKDRVRPFDNCDGVEASIGVVIRRVKEEGWKLYFNFKWEPENSHALAFSVSITFEEASNPLGIERQLAQTNVKYKSGVDSDGEVFVTRQLVPDEMRDLSTILPATVEEWISLWKRIGGLKRYGAGNPTLPTNLRNKREKA